MKRLLVMLLALTLLLRFTPAVYASTPGSADGVSINDLTGRVFDGDGQTVVFTGEAIGEALREGPGRVWVNVLDGSAIGVVVDEHVADSVAVWGDYGHTGDTVRIEGVFHVACDEHGGDMDVHATAFDVLEQGVERQHRVDWLKGLVGLGGLAVAALAVRRGRRTRSEREVM